MERAMTRTTEMILNEISQQGVAEVQERSPMVLSCGGIYIPHTKRDARQWQAEVLTTSNENEPVKVFSAVRPRNVLYDMLLRESLN